MAEGSGLTAVINYSSVPKLATVPDYLKQNCIPDATYRNWNAYNTKVSFANGVDMMEAFSLLPDPQTNGGLLFSVKEETTPQVQDLLEKNGFSAFAKPIGRMQQKEEKPLRIEP